MDYLLHFFYDPPPQLIEQVQYNLFGSFAGVKGSEDILNKKHFLCYEVEENFWKHLPSQEVKGQCQCT